MQTLSPQTCLTRICLLPTLHSGSNPAAGGETKAPGGAPGKLPVGGLGSGDRQSGLSSSMQGVTEVPPWRVAGLREPSLQLLQS